MVALGGEEVHSKAVELSILFFHPLFNKTLKRHQMEYSGTRQEKALWMVTQSNPRPHLFHKYIF